MTDSLPLSLLLNVSMLLLAATLLTEFKPLRVVFRPYDNRLRDRLLLAVVFGLLAILSTLCGLEAYGAIINTRVISVTAAGLLGGPIAGIGAGLIGGIHRYLHNPDNFSALGCCVGTINFGIIGSLGYRYCRNLTGSRIFLVLITVVGELCQVVWLFILARPISSVIYLESHILLPKIIINSMGMVLFFGVLSRMKQERVNELVESQTQALYIASQCLPYLRGGLRSGPDLQSVADMICSCTTGYRVLLSDRDRLLASSGCSMDGNALPDYMAVCMEESRVAVHQCPSSSHFLSALTQNDVITAPIKSGEQVIGSMALILDKAELHLAKADIRFAETLAQFFSTILELNNLDREIALRHQAEFRAFQAQINPHFFFNTLNAVSALCRTAPDEARSLLLVLADYYRHTLSINEEFVPLEVELHNLDNYLTIVKARFADAIHFAAEIPEDTESCRLPPLIIQPLVENAVRHGGTAVDNRQVALRIVQEDARLSVSVSDRGRGFPQEVLDDLNDPSNRRYSGLFNVSKRLVSIYGTESRLQVSSTPQGSTVWFSIPVLPPAPLERRTIS